MDSTAGNAQPHKMYNHFAMGDREISAYVGDRMHRADVPVISVYGPVHFTPTQIKYSSACCDQPAFHHNHSEQYGE